jgi:4-hydroxy-tetrahydrodipicolinate reductase
MMKRVLIFLGFVASSQAFIIQRTISVERRIGLQMADDDDVPYIMVNGMPGPMAVAAAEACLRKGLLLAPVAMTGPDVASQIITVTNAVSGKNLDVRLVPSSDMDEILAGVQAQKVAAGDKNFLVIDFTHPSAVNGNARFYVANNIPFVMGTTGGDREQLMKDVEGHFCVVAPNMAKQIVALQAALEDLATKYPGAFGGYSLDVVESHQKTKADTSGTAKAVVDSIKVLADIPEYTYDDIRLIRGDQESIEFGVPAAAIKGHAFHTYTLSSADNSVHFVLQHNVEGRTIYAEGTADAVRFLSEKIKTDEIPRVLSMIDVLEAGAL